MSASINGPEQGHGRTLRAWVPALVIAVSYAVVAGAWIAWSDRALSGLGASAGDQSALQTYKGWLFVLVTSGLLFVFVRGWFLRFQGAHAQMQEGLDRLSLALGSARGGVWDRDLVAGTLYISPESKALIGFGEDLPSDRAAWIGRIHPDDLPALRESTRRAIANPTGRLHDVRFRICHADGQYRWLRTRAKTLTDDQGKAVRMVGVVLDVTEQMETKRRIDHLMRHDPLTGLPNRSTFLERLDETVATYGAMGRLTVVARLDVDQFKHINDRFGTEAGDDVLRAIARRVRDAAGKKGLVGCIAGDEFVAAVPGLDTHEQGQHAVERLAAAFDEPFDIDGTSVRLTVSIGAAFHPDNGDTAENLHKAAVIALSKAREEGRGRVRFHTPGMDRAFRLLGARAHDLRHAAERGELELHYQPIVGLAGGDTLGFEALVRWNRPGEGLVPPDQFIGLAEELGFIDTLGEVVLRQACRHAASWPVGAQGPMYVAVNISPRQFDDPEFGARIERALHEAGLDPGQLELEITETALARDPAAAMPRLKTLRDFGVSVAIDDFGTGYSSLGALQSLPLSRLKIDKSFIAEYAPGNGPAVIADTILELARSLGIAVTAEGVETRTQLDILRRKRAQAAQGFLFSRPVPHDEILPLMDRKWIRTPTRARAAG